MKDRTVVVIGATGAVGQSVVRQLSHLENTQVIALVRREAPFPPNVSQVIFDFEDSEACHSFFANNPAHAFVCCIGTTIKKAGSKENFRKVDRDIPLRFLEALERSGAKPVYFFVSSVGAENPLGFYLETKAEVEKALINSTLPVCLLRPSLLIGDREEFRLGESVAEAVGKPLFKVLGKIVSSESPVYKYAPVHVDEVAAVICQKIRSDAIQHQEKVIVENREIKSLGAQAIEAR